MSFNIVREFLDERGNVVKSCRGFLRVSEFVTEISLETTGRIDVAAY
jgi:hypothetical protein